MADEFKHESLQDAESITSYLRAVIEGLEAGVIELSDDGGTLSLRPSGLLGLQVSAKRKGSRTKLQLELSWTEDKARTRAESLRIRVPSDS